MRPSVAEAHGTEFFSQESGAPRYDKANACGMKVQELESMAYWFETCWFSRLEAISEATQESGDDLIPAMYQA